MTHEIYPVGTQFGQWTVTGPPQQRSYPSLPRGVRVYPMQCSCGREATILGVSLRQGQSHRCQACAAQQRQRPTSYAPRIPIPVLEVGAVYGDWTITGVPDRIGPASTWHYPTRCACGRSGNVLATNLLRGLSKHCVRCGAALRQHSRILPVVGQVYGDWTVTGPEVRKVTPATPNGDLYVPVICKCGAEKLVFSRNLISGGTMRCRKCGANNRGLQEVGEAARSGHLLRRYGITVEEWNAMYAAQKGKCKTCGIGDKGLVVDHDHATGRVRALLCHHCNVAIGHMREDVTTSRRVANYIHFHAKLSASAALETAA